MSDPKPKTNRFLLVLTLLICCVIGVLIPYSHSELLPDNAAMGTYIADAGLSEEELTSENDSAVLSESSSSEDSSALDGSDGTDSAETQPTAAPTATFTPTPTPLLFEVSPEASVGVWTSNNNGTWSFLVDGTAYVGWLTDTDGHRYYFSEDGLMKTGLADIGENRYYFDEDGIMQTGNVTYKEKVYYFNEEGILEGPAADLPEEPEITITTVKIENEAADNAADDPVEAVEETQISEDTGVDSSTDSTTATTETATSAIALTFSDAPSAMTSSILDCLNANNASATFFMVGSSVSGNEDLLSQITASGSEIGNQSYSNIDLTIFDNESVTGEFKACEEIITNSGADAPVIARVPEGIVTDSIIASTPYPIILWSIDSNNLNASDAESLAEGLVSQVQDGDIVLLHDDDEMTIDMLNIAIPQLIEKGFQLTTVSNLAQMNGISLEQGQTYTNLKNPGV